MRALRGLDNCSRGSASCRRVPRCVRPLHHFSGQPRRSTSLQQHLLNYSRVDFLQALSNPQCVPAAGTLQARCRHAAGTHLAASPTPSPVSVLSLAVQLYCHWHCSSPHLLSSNVALAVKNVVATIALADEYTLSFVLNACLQGLCTPCTYTPQAAKRTTTISLHWL